MISFNKSKVDFHRFESKQEAMFGKEQKEREREREREREKERSMYPMIRNTK